MERIEKIFQGKGARIYFEKMGDGETVLFIHAGIADSRMWDTEFETLASKFSVLRFDLPGFGFSSFDGMEFSYVELIKELLDEVEIDKVHIVAASYGGKIALDFVLKYPERCRKVVLVSPAMSGWQDSSFLQAYSIEEARLLEVRAYEAAAELNFFTWILGGRKAEEVSSDLKELVLDMQMKSFLKSENELPGEEITEPDQINRIREIKAPILLFMGDRDAPDFQKIGDWILEIGQDVQKVVVENAGHLANLEAKELFSKTVEEFLMAEDATHGV